MGMLDWIKERGKAPEAKPAEKTPERAPVPEQSEYKSVASMPAGEQARAREAAAIMEKAASFQKPEGSPQGDVPKVTVEQGKDIPQGKPLTPSPTPSAGKGRGMER